MTARASIGVALPSPLTSTNGGGSDCEGVGNVPDPRVLIQLITSKASIGETTPSSFTSTFNRSFCQGRTGATSTVTKAALDTPPALSETV